MVMAGRSVHLSTLLHGRARIEQAIKHFFMHIISLVVHGEGFMTLTYSGPEVIKLFSCSTQLSRKFQLLIKTKIQAKNNCLALSLSDVVFIMLINVKMPTIVGIFNIYEQDEFCVKLR